MEPIKITGRYANAIDNYRNAIEAAQRSIEDYESLIEVAKAGAIEAMIADGTIPPVGTNVWVKQDFIEKVFIHTTEVQPDKPYEIMGYYAALGGEILANVWLPSGLNGVLASAISTTPPTPALTFTAYQQQAATTAKPSITDDPDYMILGAMGELGEIAQLRKRELRDSTTVSQEVMRAELGDVLWYLAMLAKCYGLDLGQVAQGNLDKLRDRQERGVIGGSGDKR